MIVNYVIEPQHHPMLIVYYEDLKRNVVRELKRMLAFLDVSYSVNDLHNMMLSKFDQFHRNHSDEFEHYTKSQKQLINSIISWAIDNVSKHVYNDKEIHIGHLKSYLQ